MSSRVASGRRTGRRRRTGIELGDSFASLRRKPGENVRDVVGNQQKASKVTMIPTDPTLKPVGNNRADIYRKYNRALMSLEEATHHKIVASLLKHEERLSMSAATIRSINGTIGTPSDNMMGTTKGGFLCGTCGMTGKNCRGHPGVIVFGRPIYNPYFFRTGTLIRILTCVCKSCGGTFLSHDDLVSKGIASTKQKKRLDALSKITSRSQKCNRKIVKNGKVENCKGRALLYDSKASIDAASVVYSIDKKNKSNKITMPIEDVEKILSNISDESARLMGFVDGSVPVRMIMKSMIVTPESIRPTTITNGMSQYDDATKIYKKIITANKSLVDSINGIANKEFIGEHSITLYKAVDEYQSHITTLIQGKDALMRNTAAKRGDLSIRGVITPDDNLPVDTISIPRRGSAKLTPFVNVKGDNLAEVREMWKNGDIIMLVPGSGDREGKKIQYNKNIDITINPGDVVYRKLKEGDWVVASRQPALGGNSISAFKVVINDGATIKLNLTVTSAFNADFDGDEMNVEISGCSSSLKDVKELMAVKHAIVSPHNSKPVVAPTFDTLTGIFLITKKGKNCGGAINKNTISSAMSNLISACQLRTLSSRLKKWNIPKVSGYALFSITLPEDFNYIRGEITIVDGVLIDGTITKKQAGTSHRSIVQEILHKYGKDRCISWMTDIVKTTRIFLDSYGHSVGISDCSYGTTKKSREIIARALENLEEEVDSILPPNKDSVEDKNRYEGQIRSATSKFQSVGMLLAKNSMTSDNPISVMVDSGSKGALFNTQQIGGGLGQQSYDSKRIGVDTETGINSFIYGDSIFPSSNADPDNIFEQQEGEIIIETDHLENIESKGFVNENFTDGLKPYSLFLHSAGGRGGVSESSNSVPVVGRLQRMISKSEENLINTEHGSIVDSEGNLYITLYGGDGLDPKLLVKVDDGKTSLFTCPFDIASIANDINASYGYYKISMSTKEDITKPDE